MKDESEREQHLMSKEAINDGQSAIILYGFPPAFGLPSPGPFDMKTEIQLRMMGLKYRKAFSDNNVAPKGKTPYIDDEGTIVPDSHFIREHLEKKYSKDLDQGLTESQRATAWIAERLVEDNLYWAMVHARWAIDKNFEKGPAHFFDRLPPEIQNNARQKQRDNVLGSLRGQGMGRHTPEEIASIARRGYAALSEILGDKPFLTGERPCGADASVFAQLASALTSFLDSPIRDAVKSHANLVNYHNKMMKVYFPDYAE